MKIFVISLKNAVERRASAVHQFRGAGLDFEFYDAIEGDLDTEHFNSIDRTLYRLNTLREPHNAEIGCYASHLALWKRCVALNEPVVILEDDFDLAEGFTETVPLIRPLAAKYGFIRLEGFGRRRKALHKLRPAAYQLGSYRGSNLYYLSDVPLCMLAYAINPRAAESLVEASATLRGPVDKFLQQTWIHHTPVFALSPAVVGLSGCASTSTIGVRPAKSSNPWWLLRRAAYKGLGELKRRDFDRRQLRHLGSKSSSQQAVSSKAFE